ncbi:hypothetical protein CH289_03945 [Rhodococcus sp. RS1C4]|nr:tripartite tricarboxylate transporter TctB family protein [Rhodococcus sp. RS1C4]OZC57058.1 hypothetical protein CH289_03945 [Rhodococcus sp. RS1C4]
MSTAVPSKISPLKGKSELVVSALLLTLGVVALVDAAGLADNAATRGPLTSSTVPTFVGLILVCTGIALAVDVLRGGSGEMEGGEDLDLDTPTAWVPFVALGALFLGNAVLIEPIGWPLTGTALFWGAATALGSRALVRNLVVSAVIGFGTYFLFVHVLGVVLPAGILEGVI